MGRAPSGITQSSFPRIAWGVVVSGYDRLRKVRKGLYAFIEALFSDYSCPDAGAALVPLEGTT